MHKSNGTQVRNFTIKLLQKIISNKLQSCIMFHYQTNLYLGVVAATITYGYFLNIFLSASIDPEELSFLRDRSQPPGAMDGPEERVQGDRGGGQLELEGGGRHARRGVAGVQVDLASRAGQAAGHWAGAVLGLDLVLLLVVEEVTPGTIGAVAGNPVFLASLGLVFAVLAHITHFLK